MNMGDIAFTVGLGILIGCITVYSIMLNFAYYSFDDYQKQFKIAERNCKNNGGVKSFNMDNEFICENGVKFQLSINESE